MLLRSLLAAACVAACGPSNPSHQCDFFGDASQPMQLEPITVDAAGVFHLVHEGDSLLLQRPPQGGYVIYAGAAARNLLPCGAVMTAFLIDRATGNPLTNLDQRHADLSAASGGYGFPAHNYSQTPNIPACPDALHVGVVGRDATLHVEVTDGESRTATVDVRVTAACVGDAFCACLCGPDPSKC